METGLFFFLLVILLISTYYIFPKILGINQPSSKERRKLGVFTVQVNQIAKSIESIKIKVLGSKINEFHFIEIQNDQISFKIKKQHFVIKLKIDPNYNSNYSLDIKITNDKTTRFQFSFVKDVYLDIFPIFQELQILIVKRKIELNHFIVLNKQVNFSDRVEDYVISTNDFKRNNETDAKYRKQYFLLLLDVFNNKCANCDDNANGIDVDHFFICKKQGGNFILNHKDGSFINNAIPLCKTCNRSKSDKDYIVFFTSAKIFEILDKNKIMTDRLNSKNQS